MENIRTVMAKRNSGMSCENLQVPVGFVKEMQEITEQKPVFVGTFEELDKFLDHDAK